MKLYKYLPNKYLDGLISGKLLFRPLQYFRLYEADKIRGDRYEGIHIDRPDNLVTLQNLSGGFSVSDHFSMHTSINQELVHVYCLSNNHNADLFKAFDSDVCLEIDGLKFLQKVRAYFRSRPHYQFFANKVSYYQKNKGVEANINNPNEIPFLKLEDYKYQDEFRLVFGRKKAFKLLKQIKYPLAEVFDDIEVLNSLKTNEFIVNIGDISGITKIHNL